MLHLAAINTGFLVSFFSLALVGTVSVRTLLRWIMSESRANGGTLRNVIIVGCGPRGAEFGKKIRNKPEYGYLLLGYVDDISPPENPLHGGPEKLLGAPEELRELIEEHDVDWLKVDS